ncbi:MAG TPA: hypothetical protein VE088_08030 [Gaiellaceae bacterium]|nr:hypothetical protein [Gaiellaceae bacterium]
MTVAALEGAPDYAEAFEAWRVWRVVRHDGDLALASVVKRTVWPAGEPLAAECLKALPLFDWLRRRQPHVAPEPRCECGIYAAGLDCVRSYLTDALPDARARVIGRVALWGSVVECERGFRASYAYPLALYVPLPRRGRSRAAIEEVAEALTRYDVPVEVLSIDRSDVGALLHALD